jgi:flagellar basal body-associated protein FliL
MTEQVTKESETYETQQDNNTAHRIVYIIFAVISALLAIRLIFRLLGANPENAFVRGIYSFTQPLVGIFEGIFSPVTINGGAVFEPAIVIAMVVIALIFWVVLKLMVPRSRTRYEKIEHKKQDESDDANI